MGVSKGVLSLGEHVSMEALLSGRVGMSRQITNPAQMGTIAAILQGLKESLIGGHKLALGEHS